MKNPLLVALIAVAMAGGIAAYFYWQQSQPTPESVHVQAPPAPLAPEPVMPEVRQIIEAPAELPPLPALGDSDNLILDALTGLVGNKSLIAFFRSTRIIRNIVATIDNLPTRRAPMSVMPVERAPGKFVTAGAEGDLAISPENSARYASYVRIANAVSAQKLVEVYVRLYPLFQQAYEELGYPKKYFNDRLVETIDNLLETPVIKEPLKLVQPNVLYQFADPALEARSIGQRILIRTGSKSEATIRAKLREIKLELRLHMHEKQVEITG